ncbi:MAG: carbohydrate porin [Burkholderiales bacterium]
MACHGDKSRRAARDAGLPADNTETAWELTYRAQGKPWLAVQPTLQYVHNPGTDPALDDAVVLGGRFEIIF